MPDDNDLIISLLKGQKKNPGLSKQDFNDRFYGYGPAPGITNHVFNNRFYGQSQKLPIQAPGEDFTDASTGLESNSDYIAGHATQYSLHDDEVRPKWPSDNFYYYMPTPFYPDASKKYSGR